MPPFENGRRLCLLAEAGRTRFCVEATSVVEVTVPAPGLIPMRGGGEVRALAELLGGPAEQGPGMVVAFDVNPPLVVRVRTVVEVADVASAPSFALPACLGEGLRALSRQALLHKDRLYLELLPEALPRLPGRLEPPPHLQVPLLEYPPDRALVFESQGRLFGLPLLQVLKVVPRSDSFFLLPTVGGPLAGLQPQGERLWPICSAPALQGQQAEPEPFCVLGEADGRSFGLCATRVLGVYARFRPDAQPGLFTAPGLPDPALFLDCQAVGW